MWHKMTKHNKAFSSKQTFYSHFHNFCALNYSEMMNCYVLLGHKKLFVINNSKSLV